MGIVTSACYEGWHSRCPGWFGEGEPCGCICHRKEGRNRYDVFVVPEGDAQSLQGCDWGWYSVCVYLPQQGKWPHPKFHYWGREAIVRR